MDNGLAKNGYCLCLCGEKTIISDKTDRRRGFVKGKARDYVNLEHRERHRLAMAQQITPQQRAIEIDVRIRSIQEVVKRSFIEVGTLACEAEDGMLWAYLESPESGEAYQTFDEWILSCCSYGRASVYAAKKIVRELKGIPLDDLYEIPRANLGQLILVAPSDRLKAQVSVMEGKGKVSWVEAAKMLPAAVFESKVIMGKPDLHIEKRQRVTFSFEESALSVVDKALTEAIDELEKDGIPQANKEAGLEHICNVYLQR